MDKAIIFFMSHSAIALALAISIVIVATISNDDENRGQVFIKGKNRYRRNTPAVTRVEEWTKALTGVGAAIAAGSHLENGIWALLVIAAIRISILVHETMSWLQMLTETQCPSLNMRAIAISSITSPIRLVKAVIRPAPRLFALL